LIVLEPDTLDTFLPKSAAIMDNIFESENNGAMDAGSSPISENPFGAIASEKRKPRVSKPQSTGRKQL
jgi:hypothetical protein